MQNDPRWADEESERRYRYEKIRRQRIVIFAFPAIVSFSIFIFLLFMPVSGSLRSMLTVIAMVSILLSGIGFLMTYLQTGFSRRLTTDPYVFRYDNELAEIRHRLPRLDSIDDLRLNQLQESIGALKNDLRAIQASTGQLSDQQTEQLFVALRNRFAEEEAQRFLSEIESSIREQLSKDLRAKAISAQSDSTLQRLRMEIAALRLGGRSLHFYIRAK
jgi:hypothetical protein